MSEQLFIRLGSQVTDTVHWLVWSTNGSEVIASGELESAAQLEQLQEKSAARETIILVPGQDVSLKAIDIPAKSKKAIQAAAPYALEDELAQEVEQLFFAYADVKQSSENCLVAIIDKLKMDQWAQWLADADIKSFVMQPDVLSLPNASEYWQAVTLGEQILLKQGDWQASVIDVSLWHDISQFWTIETEGEDEQSVTIEHYSALPETASQITLDAKPEELPLALLAQHFDKGYCNLLQGEYGIKRESSPLVKTWGWAAGFVVLALLTSLLTKTVHLMQLEEQQEQVEAQIIETYKRAFPEVKRVRIATLKSQLKRKMQGIGESTSEQHFLTMLSQMQEAFKQVPELKPDSLKYDGKRNEFRMQAQARDYQDFESFKQALEKQQLKVSQGALNNQGESVSGALSITSNTGGRS